MNRACCRLTGGSDCLSTDAPSFSFGMSESALTYISTNPILSEAHNCSRAQRLRFVLASRRGGVCRSVPIKAKRQTSRQMMTATTARRAAN
jgi:hypothetical protein